MAQNSLQSTELSGLREEIKLKSKVTIKDWTKTNVWTFVRPICRAFG